MSQIAYRYAIGCAFAALSLTCETRTTVQATSTVTDAPSTTQDAMITRASSSISHAATLALSEDQQLLVTVRPDEDAVAIYSLQTHQQRTLQLSPVPTTFGEAPYVATDYPRSVALSSDASRAWIACERSGEVVLIDPRRGTIVTRRRVCARPISVAVDSVGSQVVVTCAADDVVLALDGDTLLERGRVAVGPMPWALVVDADRARAHITHLHGPGVSTLQLRPTFSWRSSTEIQEVAPRGCRTLSHGKPRSFYDLNVHPQTHALWVVHELHGDDTPQPELDFESTVFPAVSIVDDSSVTTLSTDSRLAGVDGAFGDNDYESILGGLTYYFGADASLKDRHRKQDPESALFGLFKAVEQERQEQCAIYGCGP